jgi:ABC-type transport system involved in multi-copper enzyme maturation permease subunit
MPIAEQGYAHWTGTFSAHPRPWRVIARLGIRQAFRRKFFKLLFSLSCFPALVAVAGIYISERLEDFQFMVRGRDPSGFLNVGPESFRMYFANDGLLLLLVLILVLAGAGLIADDLKFGSLQLYFSRPLRKRDYLGGKTATLLFFLLLVTLVPGLLFIALKVIFAGSFAFLASYPWLPFSVTAFSLFLSLFLASYALLLSSLSRNRRFVSVLIVLVYFASDIFYEIFNGIFHEPLFSLLSIKSNIQQVAAAAFRVAPPRDLPWTYSLLVLVLIAAAGAWILRKRTRSVEVIR